MQGNAEIEARNASLIAIQKIAQQIQIDNKLSIEESLTKLLAELKENIEFIENLKKTSDSEAEALVNVAIEGNKIIGELEQRIFEKNRNVAAYLKSTFNKIKGYYQLFLTSNNSSPTQAVKLPVAAIAKSEELHADKLSVLFPMSSPNVLCERLYVEEKVKIWLKDKIPEYLQLGAAISQGDCFYDAVAQELNQKEGKEEYTIKSLRVLCDEYAKDPKNSWVEKANQKDREDHQSYLVRIQFTAQELLEKEAQGLKLGTAVWGRPKIEGKIFCEQFNIKIHVIEIQEDGTVHRYLVNKNGETEDYNPQIDYSDNNILHIVNYYNHYVPLLNSQLHQKVAISFQPTSLLHQLAERNPDLLEKTSNQGEEKDLAISSSDKFLPSMIMSNFIAGQNIYAEQHAHQHIHKPLPPADKLPEIWNVPQRNKLFTGREELLKQIVEYFNAKEAKHLVLTAHGLGGIGKTQLTLEYVWQNYKNYKGVCWFNAESRERLMIEYVSLGQELHLFLDTEKNISLDEKAKLVKTYLEEPQRAGWLLIYDSALKQDDINNLIPVKEGKILISSRHIHWPQYQTIAVGLFSLKEAQNYMKKIIRENKYNETEANLLIQKLGNLPLALAQACAYIEQNNISIAEYLDLYQKKHEMLLVENLLPQDEYQKAVAVTWNITLDQMKKEAPESVQLLYCCSHLYHEQIPEILVPHFFEGADETEKKLIANKVKRIAKQYSMITIDEQKQTFSMHSLVQQVIRDQLIKEIKDFDYLLKGSEALNKLYPYDRDKMVDFALKRALKPHLEQVLKYLDRYLNRLNLLSDEKAKQEIFHIKKDTLLPVLICLAKTYDDLGDAIKQTILMERALEIHKIHYNKENMLLAGILNNLATAYGDLGDANKQKTLLERVLVIVIAHYGEDHVEVAIVLNSLANAYHALGNPSKGKELLERALKIQEAHYGREHVKVAVTLNNLGNAYGDLGEALKKKELLERALKILQMHYGEEHFEVAHILNNLATAYYILGDNEKQIDLLEQSLKVNEAYYGKDHVVVAKNLGNLANSYGRLGKPIKALELLKEVLRIIEKHYGKDHVEVAKTLENLAIVYSDLEDVNKQKELLVHVLKMKEMYYGNKHIEVVKTLNNLANAHAKLRDAKEAKNLLERALKIQETHYGKDHIEIVKTLNILVEMYDALGDTKKQKELLERSLKITESHYGKDHYKVAMLLFPLSLCFYGENNLIEAKQYVERAYEIFVNSPNCGEKNQHLIQQAKHVLDSINQKLRISQIKENVLGNLFTEFFNKPIANSNDQLGKIIKNYNLPDASQDSLEKGLRMAVINNQIEDINVFIKAGVDVNSQDNYTKKTALHRAVINQSKVCIKALLLAGAQFNIKDALGKTVFEYAKETNDNEILSLFLIHKNTLQSLKR